MKVLLPMLAVAALCASLVTAQFPRPLRQARLFPFGWRSSRPSQARIFPFGWRSSRPAPIRLHRFYPSQAQQYSPPDNSFKSLPLTRFADQQQVVTPFQPSSHFNRGHAGPQPSNGFSSYSSIDALPLEPVDINVPVGQVESTRIPVLRDDGNPPPKVDNEIVVDSKPQAAIGPAVDMYQQLNLIETAQSEGEDTDDVTVSPVEGAVAESTLTPIVFQKPEYPRAEIVIDNEPAKNFIAMFYGSSSRPEGTGNQVVPIASNTAFSTSPAEVRPVLTVPRGPHNFGSPINYSGNDLITEHLQTVPIISIDSEQEFDQPKIESILEVDPNIYQVQEESRRPEPSFENVRVIKTILPLSRTKNENSITTQTSAERENVIALTEEEFDELATGIAESFVIIASPEEQLNNRDETKPIEPSQKDDSLIESDSASNALNSEADTNESVANSFSPPPTKDIPIRATPSILIEQLKQNYPPKSIQDTIASTEDTTESSPLSSDSLSELISGSSGAVPVISVPEISGLYLTPTADDPSIFRGGIGGLPLQDHRTGEASANVGVAVLPEAIPVDGKTRGMGYRFSYSVEDDHSGTYFSRFEQSDGELTQGQYRVLLPDGRTQVVKFFDDGLGYQADVAYV